MFKNNATNLTNNTIVVWDKAIPDGRGGNVLADIYTASDGTMHLHIWSKVLENSAWAEAVIMHETMHTSDVHGNGILMTHPTTGVTYEYGGRPFGDTITDGGWENYCTP